MFLSFSFDSLLYRWIRDVLTGLLARSVQELWLIKGLPATIVDGAGVKGLVLGLAKRQKLYCSIHFLGKESTWVCTAKLVMFYLYRKCVSLVHVLTHQWWNECFAFCFVACVWTIDRLREIFTVWRMWKLFVQTNDKFLTKCLTKQINPRVKVLLLSRCVLNAAVANTYILYKERRLQNTAPWNGDCLRRNWQLIWSCLWRKSVLTTQCFLPQYGLPSTAHFLNWHKQYRRKCINHWRQENAVTI